MFKHVISSPLSSGEDNFVEKKTAYLAELRASTKKLQQEINTFLTQQMDLDKADATKADSGAEGKMNAKTKDEVEEEQYGEEQVEDD